MEYKIQEALTIISGIAIVVFSILASLFVIVATTMYLVTPGPAGELPGKLFFAAFISLVLALAAGLFRTIID
jgi:hypothetical protein